MTRIGTTIVAVTAVLLGNSFAEQKPSPANGTDDLFWKKLEGRVDEIAERFDGVMGVAIVDLTDDRGILKNADHVFPTASSIKIAILLELYRQEQQARGGTPGKAKLDDTYTFDAKDVVDGSQIMTGLTSGVTRLTNRDLAQFTVAVSDNAAANVLIDRVSMQNVNATLRNLGLTKTMLSRKMMDIAAAKRGEENVSTPQEMTRLLQAIYQGKALDKGLTEAFMKQLSTKKESYIPRQLPPDVPVANKPGDLDGVCTDSGIVFAKNRPFVISVMTAYDRDERAAEATIAPIALEAYHYIKLRGKITEYGPVLDRN